MYEHLDIIKNENKELNCLIDNLFLKHLWIVARIFEK